MPAWLEAAIMRAVAVDPNERFEDVEELIHVLETGSAVAAPPSASTSRSKAGCAVNRAVSGSNQRAMPPCSALYSVDCQCARCATGFSRSASAMKQPWRRRR